jgi:multidrug efflux pump
VNKVATIGRYDGLYSMSVAANVTPGIDSNKKLDLVKAWEKEQVAAGNIPAGTHIVYGGADEQQAETGAFIMKAFAVAMAMIALILLLEYNSFWQVVVTISTIGMSLAGVMLGLAITQSPFSMIMTGLGIVALAGIVVKNGIVLTDTYNHYNRDDGVEPVKAMLITISQRVRPVLLTATVTALGVIPMALNVEFDFIGREITVGGLAGTWFVALSIALVSGLFFSTALTLVMVPVMIVMPKVAGHQLARFFIGLWHLPGHLLGMVFRPRTKAVTPEGEVVEVPEEAPVQPAIAAQKSANDEDGNRQAAE